MNDTSPEIERMYREMLLDRSRADRLKMGCSMFATARALVKASETQKDPTASAAAQRRALFLRFYGHEFSEAEREKILARLAEDVRERRRPAMKVAVDWDMLEAALTSNSGEMTCYLDVRTGEVLLLPIDRFDADDLWPSDEQIETDLDAGHLVHIEPLGSDLQYEWMAEFASSVTDRRLRERLDTALHRSRPFRRFKDVVHGDPHTREQWFAFHDDRVRQAAREWLAEQEIDPTTEPRARR